MKLVNRTRRLAWAVISGMAVLGVGACGGPAREGRASDPSTALSGTDAVESTMGSTVLGATTETPAASSTVVAQSSATGSTGTRYDALDAFVKAIVALTRDGSPKLHLEDVLRLSPNLSEQDFRQIDGDLGLSHPIEGGCAWFVVRDHHQIGLGFTEGGDCATASPPKFTLDGAGLVWGPEALEHIDRIAMGLASRLSDWAIEEVLKLPSLPTPADLVNAFPGLEFVDTATSVGQAAVALIGNEALIAVRGQSGNCYLIHTSASSHTTVQYGVASECTPDAAARLATFDNWP